MRDITTADQRRRRDALVAKGLQTHEQATAGVLADFRCDYCGIAFLDPEHPTTFISG